MRTLAVAQTQAQWFAFPLAFPALALTITEAFALAMALAFPVALAFTFTIALSFPGVVADTVAIFIHEVRALSRTRSVPVSFAAFRRYERGHPKQERHDQCPLVHAGSPCPFRPIGSSVCGARHVRDAFRKRTYTIRVPLDNSFTNKDLREYDRAQ
jgi:hypothetical protein